MPDSDSPIREVWAHNLEQEFQTIRKLVRTHPYVAMDTEFPGIVARPYGEFRSQTHYQYQHMRVNVNLLKIIQLGFTFFDTKGELAGPISTFQFNFKFNLHEDMYAQDSIDLLHNSGIDFEKHCTDGIDTFAFSEKMHGSGLVLFDRITWLSFHSGFDFGYLITALTDAPLPEDEAEFFDLLQAYFPRIYDIKYLMKSCKTLKGGLQEVAEQLEVKRIGRQHQAGSDSLLTGLSFFRMKEMFFEDNIDDSKYCGRLYGFDGTYAQNGYDQQNLFQFSSNQTANNTDTSS